MRVHFGRLDSRGYGGDLAVVDNSAITANNAEFLSADPACHIQLRPLLANDLPHRAPRAGDTALLVVAVPSDPLIEFIAIDMDRALVKKLAPRRASRDRPPLADQQVWLAAASQDRHGPAGLG